MVIKTQTKLDLALLCEHDLGGGHTAEVHSGNLVELWKDFEELVDNLADNGLWEGTYKL